ncbi:Cleavage stimulation factor subunit 1 [Hypsibius exemplaris]|uniref:Cleavage stimulation factor 50 kDa subunit n=1 Tax=Hypsibius exemplaris TaxID=2072580 RepID=A0A1W0WBI5_HYPEX|nr:Cleavage stimulation factor subunit 1 [Hypsibius exemplaris]
MMEFPVPVPMEPDEPGPESHHIMSNGHVEFHSHQVRERMYRLVISQLFQDGHGALGVSLATALQLHEPPCPPSDELYSIVAKHIPRKAKLEDESGGLEDGIDLNRDSTVEITSPPLTIYEFAVSTGHRGPIHAAAFNSNGTMLASGSQDGYIKVYDVEKILQVGLDFQRPPQDLIEQRCTVRVLSDHNESISAISFHPDPDQQMFLTGSYDCTARIYGFDKPGNKKALRIFQESEPIRDVAFHPSGRFALVGTVHPTLRLYDVETGRAFVSANPSDQHTGSITSVAYTKDGRLYASGSKDGAIKIWDGVSNRCVQTIPSAHDSTQINSVVFSKNGKFILSSGKDALVKLWEVDAVRQMMYYAGAGGQGYTPFRTQAQFNHNEEQVLYPSASGHLVVWNSRNAARLASLPLEHNGLVKRLCHSPTEPAYVTAGEDGRMRFYAKSARVVVKNGLTDEKYTNRLVNAF